MYNLYDLTAVLVNVANYDYANIIMSSFSQQCSYGPSLPIPLQI